MATKGTLTKFLIFCLSSVILSGCSTAKPKSFNPSAIQKDASVKIVSELANDEILLEFAPSTTGGAAGVQLGLVGALVGSVVDASINDSRAKSAEEKVTPFRVASSSVDMGQAILTNLQAYPLASPWPASVNVVSEKLRKSEVRADTLSKLDERYLVYINTTYRLKPSLQALELYTTYGVWDKQHAAGKKRNYNRKIAPVYTNYIVYQSFPYNANKRFLPEAERQAKIAAYTIKYPIGDTVSKSKQQENKAKVNRFIRALARETSEIASYSPEGNAWLDKDGELLKLAMQEGAKEVARIIMLDLSGELPVPESTVSNKNKVTKYVLATGVDGRVLESQVQGGLISRHKDYPLYTAMD